MPKMYISKNCCSVLMLAKGSKGVDKKSLVNKNKSEYKSKKKWIENISSLNYLFYYNTIKDQKWQFFDFF